MAAEEHEAEERDEINPCEDPVAARTGRTFSKYPPLRYAMEEHRRETSKTETNQSDDDDLEGKRQVFFEGGERHWK